MVTAYIGLGSNQGNRAAFIARALKELTETPGISHMRVSRLQETKPLGPVKQSDFINGVAKLETLLGPVELLDALLAIEKKLGRVRKKRWGPRTIDLDILLYGHRIIDHPRLRVPHPEIAHRPFILEGLHELEAWTRSPHHS